MGKTLYYFTRNNIYVIGDCLKGHSNANWDIYVWWARFVFCVWIYYSCCI